MCIPKTFQDNCSKKKDFFDKFFLMERLYVGRHSETIIVATSLCFALHFRTLAKWIPKKPDFRLKWPTLRSPNSPGKMIFRKIKIFKGENHLIFRLKQTDRKNRFSANSKFFENWYFHKNKSYSCLKSRKWWFITGVSNFEEL